MNDRELIEKWIATFGKGVDKKLIEDHVLSHGNHLWHLFTWGNVACFEGDEARKAFDDLQYTEAIRFYDGYSNHIDDVSYVDKITAKSVDKDKNSDVYIVAKDYSWTYVRTHEDGLGPYFCMRPELRIHLEDNEWPLEYIDHDRQIVRAIVFDDSGYFYFVRAVRNDDFGEATLIETSGGGVEPGEDLRTAIYRELKEELGVNVEIVCKLGVVDDYYNLIHRHNINNYYLCKVVSFGEKNLTEDEIVSFHLSTLKLSYEEALLEYQKCSATRIGRLVANRELPILRHAKMILDRKLKNMREGK